MKKIILNKILPLIFVLICFAVALILYFQGKITLLPGKEIHLANQTNKTVEISFTEKNYILSYSNRPLSSVAVISSFEDRDNWQGDGEIDYSNKTEGNSSLLLNSKNGTKATADFIINQALNLNDPSNVRLLINQRTNPGSLDSLYLDLENSNNGEIYRYSIRDLHQGWNALTIPFDKFLKIESNLSEEGTDKVKPSIVGSVNCVSLGLISRPKTVSTFNFDLLWIENKNDYLEDWVYDKPQFLGVLPYIDKLNLVVLGSEGKTAIIKKIGSAKSYDIQGKFIALAEGSFGFFVKGNNSDGYGYYLLLDGIGNSGWQISKFGLFNDKVQTVILDKGNISNFKVEKELTYYLKAVIREYKISFYISLDGSVFTKLGETSDSSFSSGGVGIATMSQGIFLVDDLRFSR